MNFVPKMIIRIIALFICSSIPLFAAVVFDLNDVVLDGNSGENTYITKNGAGSLVYDGGGTPSLTYTLTTSGSYSYFSSYFDSQTLSTVGEGIEISYSFTPNSTSTFKTQVNAFRVGFYNSNGSPVSDDSNENYQVEFNNDTGYMALYSPNATPSGDYFYQRTGTNNILWSSSSRTAVSGSPLLDSPGTGLSVTGLLRVELISSTSIRLTSQINGNSSQSVVHSVVDSDDLDTSFDMLSFFAMPNGNGQSLTFDEMTVTTIPEPSSIVLMMGAAGLFLISGVRLRRSMRRR